MSATIPSLMQAPRAFGYCRKSTNEQREESLEAQQRAIVTFAATAAYDRMIADYLAAAAR